LGLDFSICLLVATTSESSYGCLVPTIRELHAISRGLPAENDVSFMISPISFNTLAIFRRSKLHLKTMSHSFTRVSYEQNVRTYPKAYLPNKVLS